MSNFWEPQRFWQEEMRRLDLLLHREILRLRAGYQLSVDEFHGVYISDEQVDSYLRQNAESAGDLSVAELTRQAQEMRFANAARLHPDSPWAQLLDEFALTPHESDLLLLALAPDFAVKYETLYAYLNNDVVRKWPTHDLAVRVLCHSPQEKLELRARLTTTATLFSCGLLLHLPTSSDRPSWTSGSFCAAPALAQHLLGMTMVDPRLGHFVEVLPPAPPAQDLELPAQVSAMVRRLPALFAKEGDKGSFMAGIMEGTPSQQGGPLILLAGRAGSGRARAAAALSASLKLPLIKVDLGGLFIDALGDAARWRQVCRAICLQHRLQRSALYLAECEALFDGDGNPCVELYALIQILLPNARPVLIAAPPEPLWQGLGANVRRLTVKISEPEFAERRQLWETGSAAAGQRLAASESAALAGRFLMTPGSIRHAIQQASDAAVLYGKNGTPFLAELMEAARSDTEINLGRLAVKVSLIHEWKDLVLPPATLRQLQDVGAAIAHSQTVYAEWGFGRRVASSVGLTTLFAGASGTGKTMAAAVIARALGVDLYKIDLSGVVSKYIGETEKNLDRIFRAARYSSAILFFDEADALFGRRSEVKDAHDRYANIEVAYLLQKLEEHDGAVLLASNLSKNIDDAFTRRMNFVIDFPLPDEKLRLRLWRTIFPAQTPVGKDVDYSFLAKQFVLSGGDVRNVALDAAFLAAQDGRVIQMKHVAQALARQRLKQGKTPSPAEFKQYLACVQLES